MDIKTADAFHLARDNADWAGTDAEKSAAIIRAQDYIATIYDLEPDTDPLHSALIRATCWLALHFLLTFDPLKEERSVVKSKIAVEGAVTEEFEYGETAQDADRFPFITATLRPILLNRSSGGLRKMRIVR